VRNCGPRYKEGIGTTGEAEDSKPGRVREFNKGARGLVSGWEENGGGHGKGLGRTCDPTSPDGDSQKKALKPLGKRDVVSAVFSGPKGRGRRISL